MICHSENPRARIYDNLRSRFPHIFPPDLMVITAGVKAIIRMGKPGSCMEVLDMTELGESIRSFDDFTEANDPDGEHDFGSFRFRGMKLFWKIDDYSRQPDPYRYVLTVMLADEY